jgi:hypothetical protein
MSLNRTHLELTLIEVVVSEVCGSPTNLAEVEII